ncbi:MAG: AIR carboxylase family protein [Calditrichaeota bacterium]|nr:AIR carboxylase family protein [Calditrichota bacterium]
MDSQSTKMNSFKVLVLIGSPNDAAVMESARPYYGYFGIQADVVVSSAHRQPDKTRELTGRARENGYSAIVCGAGLAAHLAGVAAAHSDLPVIGVPLAGGIADGLDALLATVQMPAGVPVATLAVGKPGAINAAVLCARIFSLGDSEIQSKLANFIKNGARLPD